MPDAMLKFAAQDQFRNAVDWAVFTLGALSLAFAIGATVLTKTDILSFDTGTTAEAAVTTG